MKKNLYRVTVAPLKNKEGQDISSNPAIEFDFPCHDDISEILERVSRLEDMSHEDITRFAVGLKLLGEVMLENRKHPLFSEFGKPFGQLMKQLKTTIS